MLRCYIVDGLLITFSFICTGNGGFTDLVIAKVEEVRVRVRVGGGIRWNRFRDHACIYRESYGQAAWYICTYITIDIS